MPVIKQDNYTKKEYNKVLESYNKQEWKCPKCGSLNPSWWGDTEIVGWNEFQTRYTVNNECCGDYKRKTARAGYDVAPNECRYRRPNSSKFNVALKKPIRKKAAKRATASVKSRTKKKSTIKQSVKKPKKAKRPTRKPTTNRKTSTSRKTLNKG